MALEGKVPVLPVAMVGTDEAQPIGRKVPKVVRIGIKIGRPLDFSRYEGMEDDRFVLRSITDEIMYELMQLSGQEYVDQYAAKVKKAQGVAPAFGSREADAQAVRELGDRIPGTRAS